MKTEEKIMLGAVAIVGTYLLINQNKKDISIKGIGELNYYENQLHLIDVKGDLPYSPIIILKSGKDGQGTNNMRLNKESARAVISFLKKNMKYLD